MPSQQEQIALQEKLREVLGVGPATTMMAMWPPDELATKADLSESSAGLRTEMADLRTELRTGMGEIRSEVAMLRQELELKYATKDELFNAFSSVNESIAAQTRTFIVVQAATVVGMSGILYGFLRLG